MLINLQELWNSFIAYAWSSAIKSLQYNIVTCLAVSLFANRLIRFQNRELQYRGILIIIAVMHISTPPSSFTSIFMWLLATVRYSWCVCRSFCQFYVDLGAAATAAAAIARQWCLCCCMLTPIMVSVNTAVMPTSCHAGSNQCNRSMSY